MVSEAHSTLIHKVGNTTPSSAVSSAFYFMGDCTVCLSVREDSSGRLLLLLTSVWRVPNLPRPSSWLPKTPPPSPMAPRGPALGLWAVTQHGARSCLLYLPPPLPLWFPLPFPLGLHPIPPTFRDTQVETTASHQVSPGPQF